MACTSEQVTKALIEAAGVLAEHRTELIELDRAIGDADHGENMSRGFRAVVDALAEASPETPGATLKIAATTLISKVGGAAGPLYGTAFLRAATKLADRSEVDVPALVEALEAAVEGVQARGKAVEGDATMVDALLPAVAAAKAAAQVADATVSRVLTAAADAADKGAESTVPLVPRKGRASYLGERAVGHLDPGARSTALLLRTFAEAAR